MKQYKLDKILDRLVVLPQKLKNNVDKKIENFDPKIHLRLTCCDIGTLAIWTRYYRDNHDYMEFIYYGRPLKKIPNGRYDFNDCFVNYAACMGRNVIKGAEFEGTLIECIDYIEEFNKENKTELVKLYVY